MALRELDPLAKILRFRQPDGVGHRRQHLTTRRYATRGYAVRTLGRAPNSG